MCRVMSVGKSGYYHWLNRKESGRSLERKYLTTKIRAIFNQAKGRYGSPKIYQELKANGVHCSKQRVARIMQSEGLKSIIRKKYKVCTTDSNHTHSISENHLDRNFNQKFPSRAWVSDITYIPTDQGWIYLTTIMDLYDRKIIGWSLSRNMTTTDTVTKAWKMAAINRQIEKGMIFHSDRGVQYSSKEFRDLIKPYDIVQSMSRKGNCWDNAVAENFFKIIKSELVMHKQFHSFLHAKIAIVEFIEIWYNRKRRHSYLGYLSPVDFGIKYYKNVA